MNIRAHTHHLVIAALLLTLAGCGGGNDDSAPVTPPTPPPSPGTLIGAAGGTVTGPNGAKVVIPAGALASEVRINIEQSAIGAPPLPGGFAAAGLMFAFTPHGTTFAAPVTVTLPFDPGTVPAGITPAFFKTTNAQTQWEQIANATFGATSVSASVTNFSFAGTVIPPVTPATADNAVRLWSFREFRGDALQEIEFAAETQIGGVLEEIYEFGPAFLDLPYTTKDGIEYPEDGIADGIIMSTNDGEFFVSAEAPVGNALLPDDSIGGKVRMVQYQTFVKNAPNASYSFTLADAVSQAVDGNGVLARTCPRSRQLTEKVCDLIKAEIYLDVKAITAGPGPLITFFRTAGGAELNGSAGAWLTNAWNEAFSQTPLWDNGNFDFLTEEFGGPEGNAAFSLERPPTHSIDLSSIGVGEAFTVQVVAHAYAYNRAASPVSGAGAEAETYAGAFLWNPLTAVGTTVVTANLTRIDTPQPLTDPVDLPVTPAACTPGPGPNPESGLIQFSATNYTQVESGTTPVITVTRAGGSVGAVTATFATSDGTAVAGVDYTAVNASVFFSDGDAAARVVSIPLIQDLAHSEPDETLTVTLSQPGGCAALGTRTSAVLTIRDDDVPPPPPSFTVGGTVTGLVGTGLRLEDLQRVPIAPGNGPFTFTVPTQTGSPYEVTVRDQPNNPIQICTVSNGSGTINNANITDVSVSCVTPPVSGVLDPSFNGTGTVSAAFGGDETAMVLQPDGKIIMVGGSGTDFVLARFHTDGRLDEGFGSLGTVTTDIAGSFDAAFGVALQPDGKIVVVGSAGGGSTDDYAIVRYLTNGEVDSSFGTLGKVTVDFGGKRDRAYAVAIQPDHGIVVVGEAVIPEPSVPGFFGTDFGIVRLDANGVPDATFDADGKLTTNVGGDVDIARNVVLQGDDGAILVSGVLTLGSSALAHSGLVRYGANGALDESFGNRGVRILENFTLTEALVLQSDGRILVAGGGALMRLDANGASEFGFGNGGLAFVDFGTTNRFIRALAVQADGRILVAGIAADVTDALKNDFGLARFDSNGVLDPSFDFDGKLTLDFFGLSDGAENVAVQSDGRIVLGGFARNGSRTGYGLARINP